MTIILRGIAHAVPPHELPQDIVLQNARKILGPRYAQFERLSKTFHTSGVERRYSVAPLDWFQETKNWPERNQAYLEGATALFIDAARGALKHANLSADQIDCVVTVSSTGVATPTLEALAFREMGFRSDVRRVPLFGLGCAGGVTGLSTAAELARGRPGSNVLMVAVETCTLQFRSDRLQKSDVIATVLFGDGAAAAIVSSADETGIAQIGHGSEHLWPDTLDIMGWNVDEAGLGVVFDRSIPDFALQHINGVTQSALDKAGLQKNDIGRFICHPGGAKVVLALEEALELPTESLDIERHVLRDFGNMSAPTVLFVLEQALKQGVTGQLMMMALGPGFTASFLPMRTS